MNRAVSRNRRRPPAAKLRRDIEAASVPEIARDSSVPSEKLSSGPAESDQSEETIRKMIEAAYT